MTLWASLEIALRLGLDSQLHDTVEMLCIPVMETYVLSRPLALRIVPKIGSCSCWQMLGSQAALEELRHSALALTVPCSGETPI
jgi:hypothetical protein